MAKEPEGTAENGKTRSSRDRVVADVEALCAGRELDGVRELSDPAAVLIASGQVSPPVGRIAVQRIRNGLGFPGNGGYHQLRTLAVQTQAAIDAAERPQPAMVRWTSRAVASEYRRRLQSQRNTFVAGGGYFASRGRDIRTARRQGIYLDPDQRGELFDALTLTPTVRATPPLPNTIQGARNWLRDVGLDQIDNILTGPRRPDGSVPDAGAGARRPGTGSGYDVGGTNPPGRYGSATGAGQSRREARQGGHGGETVGDKVRTVALPEMFTAILLEAGMLYDRLLLAYHHGGLSTDELRLQFNSEQELSEIAGDVIQLRRAANALPPAARSDGNGFSSETGLGPSFDEVWEEIVDRVAAFRELVELAEKLASEELEQRRAAVPRSTQIPGFPANPPRGGESVAPGGLGPGMATRHRIDSAADSLLGSAGQRQVSIDTMRRLREAMRRPSGPGGSDPNADHGEQGSGAAR